MLQKQPDATSFNENDLTGESDERHYYREKDGTAQFQSLGCPGGGHSLVSLWQIQ